MPEVTSRSTGNRRAVRNALFRSLMVRTHEAEARRKLREGDLYRLRTTFGPPLRVNLLEMHGSTGILPPDYVAALRTLTDQEPQPGPWKRLWRRLLWGE